MSTATIVGTTPTTRLDSTPLPLSEVSQINVLDDIGDGNGPQPVGSVKGPDVTFSFTTGVLAVGTHNFSATTLDTSGHTSPPSNIATLVVPATLAAPSAIADLKATLNPDPAPAAAAAA